MVVVERSADMLQAANDDAVDGVRTGASMGGVEARRKVCQRPEIQSNLYHLGPCQTKILPSTKMPLMECRFFHLVPSSALYAQPTKSSWTDSASRF